MQTCRCMTPFICQFCSKEEAVDHLFFHYHLSRCVWSVLNCAFACGIPNGMENMMVNWLKIFNKRTQKLVAVGVAAVLWAIRNKTCFENKLPKDPMEVNFQAAHYISQWGILQSKEEEAGRLREGAKASRASGKWDLWCIPWMGARYKKITRLMERHWGESDDLLWKDYLLSFWGRNAEPWEYFVVWNLSCGWMNVVGCWSFSYPEENRPFVFMPKAVDPRCWE